MYPHFNTTTRNTFEITDNVLRSLQGNKIRTAESVLLGVCAPLAAGILLIPAASEELHNEEFATVHPTQMTCLLKLASRSCDE